MEKKISKEISVRSTDEVGRVVLPRDLLNKLDIKAKDEVCIFEGEDGIVIKKYKPTCTFCGAEEGLVMFNKKYVCRECIQSMRYLDECEQ